MKLGIIGLGNIGSALIEHALEINDSITIYGFDVAGIINDKVTKLHSIEELFEKSDAVVEAAHPSVVKKCLELAIKHNIPLMTMSTGGLIDHQDLMKKVKLIIPSGAIAGTDAFKAASVAGVEKATLTTTKNPKSLGLDITEKQVIFHGAVDEAVHNFPKNINVAATLSLSAQFPNLQVMIIADPEMKTNTHEITVEGSFGKITTKTENVPSPNNPKTSYLAVLSAMKALEELI